MIDEQQRCDKFEKMVGGVKRAQRLLSIWNNSYSCGTKLDFLVARGKTREQVFEMRARAEGFTDKQIQCFHKLS
jgi:hypothetical protein